MPASKDKVFYRSIRRAIQALNSSTDLGTVTEKIVRNLARTMESGVSLVLLDETGTKLIHATSWGIPNSYLQKGVLDARKSLTEVVSGETAVITDVANDPSLQFPEKAISEGIASILGVPVKLEGKIAGSLRVYCQEPRDFTNATIAYVETIAGIITSVIREQNLQLHLNALRQEKPPEDKSVLRKLNKVVFAHPSEKEFASLLDFYNVEWAYEPRSFPIKWNGDKVTDMFTPDFYLPGIDLYVELTTIKQKLVTYKNRKLRLLRELYPDIKITLLYKKDYERLLEKYGFGPVSVERTHTVNRVLFTNAEIKSKVRELAATLSREYKDRRPVMVGVLRGVFCFMADLVRDMNVPVDVDFMSISHYSGDNTTGVKITKDIDLNITGRDVIMVEDIVDTGMTLSYMLKHLKAREPASLKVCALFDRRVRRISEVTLDHIGFEVPDEFIVGYGLDYKEQYRNLNFIGIVESHKTTEEKDKK